MAEMIHEWSKLLQINFLLTNLLFQLFYSHIFIKMNRTYIYTPFCYAPKLTPIRQCVTYTMVI